MSGAPVGRVARAGSTPQFIESLLGETPRVADLERQQALTDRFLAPALPAIAALLLHLRAELDPALRAAQPMRAGKPYPLGQCWGITKTVLERLRSLDPAGLSGLAAEGYAALRGFVQAGGDARRAWGVLRGLYFQNAMVIGTLYVDVSNDTVVVTKPKVEILPFAEAGFAPIADYGHYARIASSYWGFRIVPNHVLPELAPYLPLIQIAPDGQMSLGSTTRYMQGLTLANGFVPSEQALAAAPLSPSIFASLSTALGGGSSAVAQNPEDGRKAALAGCEAYRAEGRAHCAESFTRAMAAAGEANRRLATLRALPQAA